MGVKIPPIGKLRQTGQLQINTPTQQGAGKRDNFTTLLTCRGSLTKMRGNRFLDARETVIGATWEWICREQAAINNVTNKKSIRCLMKLIRTFGRLVL